MNNQRTFKQFKDVLVQITRTNFKLKYNDSFLGFIWVLLKPLSNFLILFIIFSRLGRGSGIDNYAMYLLIGNITYGFFNEGFVFGMNSLLDKAHIILKVNFPREIAVFSSIGLALINYLVNIIVMLLISIISPLNTTPLSVLYFILISLSILLVTLSISFFTSIILVRIRDLEHIASLGLYLGFFLTPIFYSIDILPSQAQQIVRLNPFFYIIQGARAALIDGRVEYLWINLSILGISAALALAGYFYFKSKVRRIAEYF